MFASRLLAALPAVLPAALLIATAGCAPKPPPPAPAVETPSFVQAPQVYLLTEGVTIEAEEDTWSIRGGEPVPPPFTSEFWELEDGVGGMLSEYQAALDAGAMRVRVTIPSLDEPMYGVLALLPVADTATSIPPKRTYRIQIPENRVQEARGGLISFIYQPYRYTYERALYDEYTRTYTVEEKTSGEIPSWVLWLSDTAF